MTANVLALLPADTELSVHVEEETGATGDLAAAVFDSQRRTYRYLLTRIWNPAMPPAVFVMLNPSTADASSNDPTIRRCLSYAVREQAGGIVIANLFALRSTDPRALTRHSDPVGPYNDAFLRRAAAGAHRVIAAWGGGGFQGGRAERVLEMLGGMRIPVSCLGVTATGQPRHPLYLRKDAALVPYEGLAS
ncbi:DUF1643 domain-containing protein [Streptomyces sp. NPDC008150]|uniref:DUF1643 domain-containing protein n=1 Tax=Streptomyces sp. NPDC008150 TaxID=3364816 RepID=UPI0036EBB4C7